MRRPAPTEPRSVPDAAGATAGGLDLSAARAVHDPSPAELVEHALRRGEGVLSAHGALIVDTGRFTGRSPKDKFIVRSGRAAEEVDWGDVNQPLDPEAFARLEADMLEAIDGAELFVQDLYAGAHPDHRVPVRIATAYAWHGLFANDMFVRGEPHGAPEWTVLDLPGFRADPERHGSRGTTIVAMDLERRLVLIADTEYAGEIKKSIFSALNFELPFQGIMPMHCSANVGPAGPDDGVALFFGLSGTGKTTLSADPERTLIGDDEHGWADDGVFNFEGGCYAKVIRLDAEAEPEIWGATRRFGTVLENIGFDPGTRVPDFEDGGRTENTRAAYPIDAIPNASATGRAGHPSNVVFLTADAFGVLPPISRLTPEQAMYHFLSGYTAKVAGTERGVTEPQATFSACFGAPFMPLHPGRYAELLGERLERHGTDVWLVNTGWTGGPHGEGERIRLRWTRAMVNAALAGELDDVETRAHPVFGLQAPVACPGVPAELLDPRGTWRDPEAYDAQARKLARMFASNFERFADGVAPRIRNAGPVADD